MDWGGGGGAEACVDYVDCEGEEDEVYGGEDAESGVVG